MKRPLEDKKVSKSLRLAKKWVIRILSDIVTLSEIPAPSDKEGEKRRRLLTLMKRMNFHTLQRDNFGNLIGVRKGRGDRKIIFTAHLDTVFHEKIDHTVRITAERVYGPGVGDDSLGIASMLALSKILDEAKIDTDNDFIFAATVRGETDFYGMRGLMETYKNEVDYVIPVEGHGLGKLGFVSVGKIRLRINSQVKGGESLSEFGRSNAIVVMNKVINQLLSIGLPIEPKTTLNLGVIEGGIAYNTVAPSCSLGVEISSEQREPLLRLHHEVSEVIYNAEYDGVRLDMEELSRCPIGGIPKTHPMVKTAVEIHKFLGIETSYGVTGFEGSVPLSMGIPSITVGITNGVNQHLVDEYIEIEPIILGLEQIILLALSLDKREIFS